MVAGVAVFALSGCGSTGAAYDDGYHGGSSDGYEDGYHDGSRVPVSGMTTTIFNR